MSLSSNRYLLSSLHTLHRICGFIDPRILVNPDLLIYRIRAFDKMDHRVWGFYTSLIESMVSMQLFHRKFGFVVDAKRNPKFLFEASARASSLAASRTETLRGSVFGINSATAPVCFNWLQWNLTFTVSLLLIWLQLRTFDIKVNVRFEIRTLSRTA